MFGAGLGLLAVPEPWWKKIWDWFKPTPVHTVALQLEHVRMKLPVLFERDDVLIRLLKKRPTPSVSIRSVRFPIQFGMPYGQGAWPKIKIHFDPNRLPD